MLDILLIILLAVILGLAAFYVIRAKKKGGKCIGCPSGGNCPHAKNGGCSGQCNL